MFFICQETNRLRTKKSKMAGQGWLYPRSLLSYTEASERPFPRWQRICKLNVWGKIPHQNGLQVFWFKLLKLWKLAPDEAF